MIELLGPKQTSSRQDGVGTAYTSRLLVNAEEWTTPARQRRDRRGDRDRRDDAGGELHLRK